MIRLSSYASIVGLALVAVVLPGCDGATGQASVAADEHGHSAALDSGDSDLDRTVADLLAARCEHGILTYTCDECRYEVGVVRAEARLFDPADGGVLRSARVTRTLTHAIQELPGEVVLDANRSVIVTPMAEGIVTAVVVDLGDRVRRGEPLLHLECPGYREAAARVAEAAAEQTTAAANLAREEALHVRRIIPEKDVLAARAEHARAEARSRLAEAALRSLGLGEDAISALRTATDAGTLVIGAPIDGVVVDRHTAQGSRVGPGDPLMVVADTSRVWVQADLREADVAAVVAAGNGLDAEIEVAAWPSRRFDGSMQLVSAALDATTRTLRARVVIDNSEGLLRPGMFARVRLAIPSLDAAIVVPAEAVLEDEGRSFAFIRAHDDYWVRRPIRIGSRFGDDVTILDGLNEGDEVVTSGAFLLKSDVLRSKMGAGCAD